MIGTVIYVRRDKREGYYAASAPATTVFFLFWLGWRYTWPSQGVLSPYDCRVIDGRFCLGLSVKGTSEKAFLSFVHNILLGGILGSSAENLHPVYLELDMGF